MCADVDLIVLGGLALQAEMGDCVSLKTVQTRKDVSKTHTSIPDFHRLNR